MNHKVQCVVLAAVACWIAMRADGALAGGVGISTASDTLVTTFEPGLFHAHRVGSRGQFRYRDLEFHWDRLYARDAGSALSDTTRDALGLLASSLVDSVANPLGAPYPDIALVYDYFRREGENYNTTDPFDSTAFRVGRPDSSASYPDRDRSHVDYYIQKPGHTVGGAGGAYPADYISALEDTSTGHSAALHYNSLGFTGPPESALNSLGWTSPTSPQVWGFNHEFQHSLPPLQVSPWSTEMMSASAEAIAGVPHVGLAGNEVAYTVSLVANPLDAAVCSLPATSLDKNYTGRRMFAAYLAYNFRGADPTPLRPVDPTNLIGFGDDLTWRWARTTLRRFSQLGPILPTSAAYFSKIDPAAGTTTSLSSSDLLNLLHHNWRVANYVNAPSYGDGRYGYPTAFGFSPAVDVGAWQIIDACSDNDVVSIPPKVMLAGDAVRRSVVRVGSRSADSGAMTHPLVLQPFGAEYWIARSGAMGAHTGHDLVITIGSDTRDASCGGTGRIMASIATYEDQTDSLWRRPEWIQEVLPPVWVDMDSIPSDLELVVPDFGNAGAATPRLAAVTTISLGDPTVVYAQQEAGLPLIQRAEYRITHELARAPYPSPFASALPARLDLVANGGKDDISPAWAPSGGEIAYASRYIGSTTQIYRRAFAPGSLSQPQVVVHAASSFNQSRPDWSPRGDWIAFDQDTIGGTTDLYLKNLQTSELRRLSATPAEFEINPVFQPNGQGLAYVKRIDTPSRRYELRWMNLAGTNDSLLVGPGTIYPIASPRWAVDGSRIYYTRRDSLYSVQLPGGFVELATGFLGTGKTTSLDVPRGAGAFVTEQSGTITETCTLPAGPNDESYRRIMLKSPLIGGPGLTRHYRRGRQFSGPRISLDGTRLAFARTESSTERDIGVGIMTYDHPPTMNPAAVDDSVVQGISFSINLATGATDPDDDAIYYMAAYLPPGASFTGSTMTWPNPQPLPGGGGPHFVVFVAYDSAGAQDYRVVRYDVPTSGGGCPVADVYTEGGWVEGNSISRRSAELVVAGDAYRLATGVAVEGVEYRVRVRENEAEESRLDELALLVIDREPGAVCVSAGDHVTRGTIQPPARVLTAEGTDVTELFSGPNPRGGVFEPGDILHVEFTPLSTGARGSIAGLLSSPESPGLHDEGGGVYMESGGKEIPPELRTAPGVELASASHDSRTLALTGIDLQVADEAGAWQTIQRHYPRSRLDAAVLDQIRGSEVRLVFVGRHEVRSLGRMAPGAEAVEVLRVEASTADHSRLGSSLTTLAASDAETVTLVNGDTLDMTFRIPASPRGLERDVFLLSRGAYRSAGAEGVVAGSGGLVLAAPFAFALGTARPNPVSGGTTIPFTLPSTAIVHLRLFDASGRLVRTLVDELREAGRHEVGWDGRSDRGTRAAAGIYFLRLDSAGRAATQKIVLVSP